MKKIKIKYSVSLFFLLIFFVGCATKEPIKSSSAIVLFKTKNMNFYDQGFINHFKSHISLQVFEVGHQVLELKVSPQRICRSTFKCMHSKAFNAKFLHKSYEDDFLYQLLKKKKIYHKDKKNKIFIKVKYVK